MKKILIKLNDKNDYIAIYLDDINVNANQHKKICNSITPLLILILKSVRLSFMMSKFTNLIDKKLLKGLTDEIIQSGTNRDEEEDSEEETDSECLQ